MLVETRLDLETVFKQYNPNFFNELPRNFSTAIFKSSMEIAENFCFCKIIFLNIF